ncbi:serine kinase [Mesorhizobium sp. M7A.F.Ca.CA.001.09.2.1]|uniref:Serine kinase n=1 Tax=Mesorhizobium ciceri TaxID=39645 RepID=A0AB38TC58_9HYPH|nr:MULTISPECIES: serine kinase [Mesorhizobium]RUY53406.1 serine kinase [Mesorhizobium sp. M7A.F.Ca.CA.001.13.2.1]MDF3213814.1 serine kinase [Mesorhizobium ciceri]RUY63973.1 serine kinase [Mesorhizobium sp. M7A.F.Ca.CA.001.05.1.1]RUY68469.1 serine kinase [Mesorhizobium sp. M7A.F.Ca.CA.001.13.1.1]RUY76824.1 serine kinase [Mesorhizobium sp. M7A.F.Ca.CA.001.09.2.1]
MTRPSACYGLNGLILGISAERSELWQDFDRMLGSLRIGEPVAPDFRLEITETDTLDETPNGSLVFDGEVPEDGPCRMIEDGGIVHLIFPGRQIVAINGGEGWAELRISTGTKAAWTPSMLVLDAALDAGGQHMLHTAGLTLPDRDAVVLIHAPSGTGKTTTSLALATQGFGLCSDDAMILNVASGKVVAWGLPRAVKIHQKTAEMIPQVAPCLGQTWDRNGEQPVSLERLGAIIRVENASARPVAALLHLARSADGQTRLVAMARTDAMVTLAVDNVRTGMTGLLPMQKRRLATIAGLVNAVPTFQLEVGARPADAAALIRGTLD